MDLTFRYYTDIVIWNYSKENNMTSTCAGYFRVDESKWGKLKKQHVYNIQTIDWLCLKHLKSLKSVSLPQLDTH